MSVQILTCDNKVVTVNTGTETKVLAAGTIPTDASDWVESEYALSQGAAGAVVHRFQIADVCVITVTISRTDSATSGTDIMFSYLGTTSPETATTSAGTLANIIAAFHNKNTFFPCIGTQVTNGSVVATFNKGAYNTYTSKWEFVDYSVNGKDHTTYSYGVSDVNEDSDVVSFTTQALSIFY